MTSVATDNLNGDYFKTSFMLNDVLKTVSLKLKPVQTRKNLPPVKPKRSSEQNEKVSYI